MNAPAAQAASTWPFWAPSQESSVLEALALAGVGPGVSVVDLGCGDGQVLAAAASLGAEVSGIEADTELVEEARTNLAEAGIAGHIVQGDLLDPDVDLDGDVLFAYLAPATLQRLLPRLRTSGARRLVTVDFAVPGLVPVDRRGAARLYDLPGRRSRVGAVGWPSAGTLVATVADVQSLSCLDLVHPAGLTGVRPSVALRRVATVFAGASCLERTDALAVDVRWEDNEAATFAGGTISTAGGGAHAVFVLFGEDEDVWELDDDAVARLRGALRHAQLPTTIDEVLALADG